MRIEERPIHIAVLLDRSFVLLQVLSSAFFEPGEFEDLLPSIKRAEVFAALQILDQ
jgi:hypothetical protein